MVVEELLEVYAPPDKRERPAVPLTPSSLARRKWTGSLPDKFIAALVTRVSQSNLKASVNDLSAFHTRHSKSTYINSVAEWLVNRFASFGFTSVTQHAYTHSGYQLSNVVCTKKGSSGAGNVTIVCSHYDCIMENASDATARAPGADDNATGVAVLLELARILNQVDLRDDVQFVAFSGEEQGYWGSTAYAQYVQNNGLNVQRLINLDEVGYPYANSGVVVEYDVNNQVAANDAPSLALANVMAQMAADYCATPVTFGPIYGSDYMPFESRGYVVIGVYEGEGNPNYHNHNDTPNTIDFACVADVTRMTLATVMHETAGIIDESAGGVDLYIRDNDTDTGSQPSDEPHWTSPDLWVRNNPPPADPNDPSDPNAGEDPDSGHQSPINNVPNYLYVRVHNRGSQASGASDFAVEAFHCNPATQMIWPTHFQSMGTIPITVAIAANGGSMRVGPFIWTPQIVDHECLVAVVSGPGDHAITDIYAGEIDHSLLVRFDNNVGQRNVMPVASTPGGKTKFSLLLRGATQPSINTLRIDAGTLPADTAIALRIARKIKDQADSLSGLTIINQSARWCTLALPGGQVGSISGFPLASSEINTLTVEIDFSYHAEHMKRYPIIVSQIQEGVLVGQLTVEITAVKETQDYVYGNVRSRELHTLDCAYRRLMTPHNQVPFRDIKDALARGYNGCAFCLPDSNTG